MHIVIIGNGISGISAARHIRKLSDHQITVISDESDYFFSRTALMYVYMGHMKTDHLKPYEDDYWHKNKIALKRARIEDIDFSKSMLISSKGEHISYDKLILALGSKPNKFGWPGQDLKRVGGLYHLQDLEQMQHYSDTIQHAVIVGGGLIGLEMAEMFHSRHKKVTMLVRESSYWDMVLPPEESQMINRHIVEHGIDLRLQTELKEIQDNGHGEAHAVKTDKDEVISCGYVGLTAGVHPNIDFIKSLHIETSRGIVVNEHLETSQPNVFAIGDCCELKQPMPGRRPIEAVWYTGKMMGESVARHICDQPTVYNPGIWYNSAKFLDIEYQVYGTVLAQAPEDHASVYWEHEAGRKSIRIVFDKASKKVLGFNLMGVRFRHEVCEKWIADETGIESVLQHLSLANFDPEFFEQYEKQVVQLFNRQFNAQLPTPVGSPYDQVVQFLQS